MPSVGELFAGVGGFGMGFERAGFTVAWQCEIDRDAVSVLERHWPDVPRYGDIATVDGADLAPVEVIIGGFPCQDLSVAGKRGGLGGARSGLFWDAVRIVRQMREATDGRYPAFVVVENVPGLLSSGDGPTHRGRDFAAVLGGLRELGAAVGYRILDARFFGVPQRRRRVFIVAGFAGLHPGAERVAEILSLVPSSSRHPAPSGAAGQGAARDAQDGAGEPLFIDAYVCRGSSSPNQHPVSESGLSDALDTTGPGGVVVPVAAYGGNRTSGSIDVATACNAHGGPHGRLDFESETFVVANSVTASAGHHGHSSPRGDGSDNLIPVAISEDQRAATWDERNVTSRAVRTRVEYGAPANTLHADGLSVITPMAVRRLTPTECCRLMGWPDDWVTYRADSSEIPDGPRYRMIGNGVVAPVSAWIAHRMRAVLEA